MPRKRNLRDFTSTIKALKSRSSCIRTGVEGLLFCRVEWQQWVESG